MLTQQYVQHDWSPSIFAAMLATLAVLVVVGMCVFLLAANRPKRLRHSVAPAPRMRHRPRSLTGHERREPPVTMSPGAPCPARL